MLPPVVISKMGVVHANKKQPVASPVLSWHAKCGWFFACSIFRFAMDESTVTCLKCSSLALSIEKTIGKGGA